MASVPVGPRHVSSSSAFPWAEVFTALAFVYLVWSLDNARALSLELLIASLGAAYGLVCAVYLVRVIRLLQEHLNPGGKEPPQPANVLDS